MLLLLALAYYSKSMLIIVVQLCINLSDLVSSFIMRHPIDELVSILVVD
jgi:hypothetical protein